MSAAAVLRRLHDAGVEVRYEAPDSIRLRGPLDDELVALVRGAKPELLAAVRPRVQVYACSCCGRFYFVEPSAVCFWCRPGKRTDNTDTTRAIEIDGHDSVGSVRPNSGPGHERACPSCGGGLHATDDDTSVCFRVSP